MPFALNTSIWNEPFKFVSLLSLEECAARLGRKDEPAKLFSFKNPLTVELHQLNKDAFQFRVQQDVGRNLLVEAIGVLERYGDKTVVSGTSRFSRYTIVLFILIICIQAPIFARFFGPTILFLDIVIAVLFVGTMIGGCRRLITVLSTELGLPTGKSELVVPKVKHSYSHLPKSRLSEIVTIIFTAAFILWIASGIGSFTGGNAEFCTIKPAPPRPIRNSMFRVTPVWSTQIGLGNGYDKPRIAIVGDRLFTQNCNDITAFDLRTGSVLWVSQNTGAFGDGIDGQMTIDAAHDQIVARKSIWGIRAISMSSGKILWTNGEKLFEHAMPYLELLDNGQLVAANSKGAWIINPDTGSLQPTTMNIGYEDLPQVVDGVELPHCYLCLKALDRATGKTLWQFGTSNGADLVSNVAADKGTVFIMDQHAQLFLLDLHTGKEKGTIQFELPQNQASLLNGPGQIGGSVIAVRDNVLAIGFQDTNVLSIYEISIP